MKSQGDLFLHNSVSVTNIPLTYYWFITKLYMYLVYKSRLPHLSPKQKKTTTKNTHTHPPLISPVSQRISTPKYNTNPVGKTGLWCNRDLSYWIQKNTEGGRLWKTSNKTSYLDWTFVNYFGIEIVILLTECFLTYLAFPSCKLCPQYRIL